MFPVFKRALLYVLSFLLLVGFNQNLAKADMVVLDGTIRTSATLTDRFVLHVPPGVAQLSVRIPIINTARRIDINALDEHVSLSDLHITSTLATTSQYDLPDAVGNTYRVLTFERPAPGNFVIEATFDNLNLETDLNRPLPNIALPTGNIPANIASYCASSKLAESNNPQIRALARTITAGTRTEAEATLAITEWMRRNIIYGITGATLKTDAIVTLSRREASCDGWSHLFIALTRAIGIPARFVGGYALAGTISYPLSSDGESNMLVTSDTLAHAWAEVWYPGAGWVPYDPQNSAGFVDTHHVPVWTGVDANGGLPLLLWRTSRPNPMMFSIGEEQYAVGITDQISLNYLRSEPGPTITAILARRER